MYQAKIKPGHCNLFTNALCHTNCKVITKMINNMTTDSKKALLDH